MNAHNEQHDSASPVVKQNLTTQPAAAQEAVAYLDIGSGGYLDIGSDLPEEQLLALPNGRHALGIIGTYGIDGYVSVPVTAAPAVTDPVAAYERELAAGATHEHALHAICTPAAPWIDLREFGIALIYAVDVLRSASGIANAKAADKLDRLIELIDASPKGDPEHGRIDPSWSLHDRVEFALRDAGFDLDEAAFVAEAASVANGDLDSPKGGSDALDATRLDWLDANGFTAYRQIDPIDGLSPHCVVVHETQLPRRGNVHDTIRGAIDAAMQAQANSHGAGVSNGN